MLEDTKNDKRILRHHDTHEDFTPEHLLHILCDDFFKDDFKDPKKKFLDNSCGNGNILVYVLKKRLESGCNYLDSLKTMYGLDIMKDNIEECHQRIKNVLSEYKIEYNEEDIDKILRHNIVCNDMFNWDFKNWKSYGSETQIELF